MGLDSRLDSADVGAFLRQLEDIESQILRIEMPELPFAQGKIVPMVIENKPWAKTHTYREISHVGQFKLIRNYTNAVPLIDVLFREYTENIYKYGSGYDYSDDDIISVARMNESLDTEKIIGVTEAANQTINELVAFGDPETGMPGFVQHPNALRSVAAYPLNDSSTGIQALSVLNYTVNAMIKVTNRIEQPDTLLLPGSVGDYLNDSLLQSGTTTLPKTVLQHFLDKNKYIKNVEFLNELEADALSERGLGDRPIMIAYKRDPRKVQVKIYQTLTFLEPRRKGLDGWLRPAKFKMAGVQLRRPYSVHIVELPQTA